MSIIATEASQRHPSLQDTNLVMVETETSPAAADFPLHDHYPLPQGTHGRCPANHRTLTTQCRPELVIKAAAMGTGQQTEHRPLHLLVVTDLDPHQQVFPLHPHHQYHPQNPQIIFHHPLPHHLYPQGIVERHLPRGEIPLKGRRPRPRPLKGGLIINYPMVPVQVHHHHRLQGSPPVAGRPHPQEIAPGRGPHHHRLRLPEVKAGRRQRLRVRRRGRRHRRLTERQPVILLLHHHPGIKDKDRRQ